MPPPDYIDPIADPVAAALALLTGNGGAIAEPLLLPEYTSRARTLAELYLEPIGPIYGRAESDCGVCAVCAAGGLTYAEFLKIDPRTPREIAARARRGTGLYAREMVRVLETVWPGSRWYVHAGRRDLTTWQPTAPRGVILTPGHWVAFGRDQAGRLTIADEGLTPAADYGGPLSKIVAPSPRNLAEQCHRARFSK